MLKSCLKVYFVAVVTTERDACKKDTLGCLLVSLVNRWEETSVANLI